MAIRKILGDNSAGANIALVSASIGIAILIYPFFLPLEACWIALSIALLNTVMVILFDEFKSFKKLEKVVNKIEDYLQYFCFVFVLVYLGSHIVDDTSNSDIEIKLENAISISEHDIWSFNKNEIDSLYNHCYQNNRFYSTMPIGGVISVCNCNEFKKHNRLKASVNSKIDEDRFFEFKLYCNLLDRCRSFTQPISQAESISLLFIDRIPVDILTAFDPKLEAQIDSFINRSMSILDYSKQKNVTLSPISGGFKIVIDHHIFTLKEILKGDFDGNRTVDCVLLIAHNTGGSFTSYAIKTLGRQNKNNMFIEI